MSWRAVTIAGFVVLGLAGIVLEAWSRRERSRVPSLGEALSWVTSATPGRVAVMLAWWWTGWHFFAR